jgi:hypothetical protein
LTGFLFSHELKHAREFLDYKHNGTQLGCVKNEVKAFEVQLDYYTALNQQEQSSLKARLRDFQTGRDNQISPFANLNMLLDYTVAAQRTCKISPREDPISVEINKCYWDNMGKILEREISADPTYQKQCGLSGN